ncbi:MAG: hypothetical protein H6652_04230 [Ardenticatenaceae bacterium]|nr:hypothetical protein [Ardenticatenaceae bacterium]MCB8946392.1 hypothetical protein [Ardenticatenaceae bacterium]
MSDTSHHQPDDNIDLVDLISLFIHDLRVPTNNGLGYCELFQLEIPLSEEKQREFQKDISRQLEEISRLLKEYQQRLQNKLR